MLFLYYIDFGLRPLHAKIYYTECNKRTEFKNVEYIIRVGKTKEVE